MADSINADNEYTHSTSRKRISRRTFCRDVSLFSLIAVAGTGLLNACNFSTEKTEDTSSMQSSGSLPEASSVTLMDAIKNRRSAQTLKTDPIPESVILELLWAAWGINRSDSGKRTAPSAMNTQEIDIYVLLQDGAFLYDAGENKLRLITEKDIRPKSGGKEFMKNAPAHVIFIADYSKFKAGSQVEQESWSACHTGFIGQNIYLYCTTQGLDAHFYAGMDRDTLKTTMQLGDTQAVIFGQAVGYSND